MSRATRNGSFLVFLCLAPAVLGAYNGFVVGQPVPGEDIGDCDTSSLRFTTPVEGAGLFVFLEPYAGLNEIMYSIEGNSKRLGCTYGAGGDYDCPACIIPPCPRAEDTVWIVATFYPDGEPGGAHEGWFHYDNGPGDASDMAPGLVPNVIQDLRHPVATTRFINAFPVLLGGTEFTFEYPTEFDTTVGDLPCEVGGRQEPIEFENRLFIGFNVYRINITQTGIDAATSTPMHYLCGPDLDCNTAGDNGWVTFIPLGDGTDEMSVDPPYPDPKPFDAYKVEERGNPNPNIVFLDTPGLSPNPPPNPRDVYSYVYQPVVRGVPDGTWNGIPSHDLDGDGTPEFLDPSGNGLGLTANGVNPGGTPTIFISAEAVTEARGPWVPRLPPATPF